MENKQLDLFENEGWPIFMAVNEYFPNNEFAELEYKAAQGGFPQDFWKTFSAFANTNGGFIVLGVSEKRNMLRIEGLSPEHVQNLKKIFWDNANNKNTISANILSNDDVKEINVGGKTLLIFKIPNAKRTDKPVYLTRNPFENTYKRNHEGDYKCTNEEVRRMLADADTNMHHDSRILEDFTLADIDTNSLKKYRQLFAGAKTSHPWLALDDKELLEKLGGYRKDRVSKKEGFTLAGILMFGKESSITDKECCPNFFPDFREILSNDPNVRWTDRIYPDGTWESNLFQFYLKIWPRLSSSLPKPFQLKNGVRQDETPAHIALREAFVNALIHSDYSSPGNIIIEHKTDSFKFSNPGTLLVSLEQYYRGGISECRNPSLQKMFLMMGSAEKAGSGVNKILAGWEFAHWRSPYLKIDSQPDRLVLELPMFSILPEETLDELRKLYGDSIDTLGKDELTILATCHIEGEISNSRLQYMIDQHRTDITKILQDLSKHGYLLSNSKGRWTTYHLNTSFNVGDKDSVVRNNGGAIDIAKDITLTPNLDTLTPNLDVLTPNLDTSVKTIDSTSKRMSRAEVESKILTICKDHYKSSEEIAKELNRNVNYIKNDFIPKLIKEEKLLRLYPTINHPHQAYKATED